MNNPCVTVDSITDEQIKQLHTLARYLLDDTLATVCEQALAGDGSAVKAVVAEINNHARTAEQRKRRAATTTVSNLIIELQRATSEYQARAAEISTRIIDAVKGE